MWHIQSNWNTLTKHKILDETHCWVIMQSYAIPGIELCFLGIFFIYLASLESTSLWIIWAIVSHSNHFSTSWIIVFIPQKGHFLRKIVLHNAQRHSCNTLAYMKILWTYYQVSLNRHQTHTLIRLSINEYEYKPMKMTF